MKRNNTGFSLLEVLVAVAVFALVGLAGQRLVASVVDVDAATRQRQADLRELMRAVAGFERDLEQAIARPVLGNGGDAEPAFWSDPDGTALQWTRAGWSNPLAQQRAELQRVRWEWRDGRLYRLYWPVLDRVQGSQPQRQAMLGHADDVRWRYLDHQGQWQAQWPGDPARPFPRAVELSFRHPRYGRLARLVLLPAIVDGDAG